MDIQSQKQTVLVVDDTPENILILTAILQTDYRVKAATSGPRAIQLADSESPPDIILLDIMMPGMDGYEVCRQLKERLNTRRIPVVFVTAMSEDEDETRGFAVGAVDYITKPFSAPVVQARVRNHLMFANQHRALEDLVRVRTAEILETRLEIIRHLGRAAEYKDNETGMHVLRMSHYCRVIALEAGLEKEAADLVLNASPMHDIGKIGIPDHVLKKPGKLTPEEWDLMRRHAQFGANIIGENSVEPLRLAHSIALTHHEKWDGSGYPNGLSGTDIPLEGRICAIADVFDALTSARPYKKAWSVEDAVGLIQNDSGTHFDPRLVNAFVNCLPAILVEKERYSEAHSIQFDAVLRADDTISALPENLAVTPGSG